MGPFPLILIRLPSTLFHEMAHLAAGLCTFSGVRSFSILPRRVNASCWMLGSVECSRLGTFSRFLVGLAPFWINVPLAWWFYNHHGFFDYILTFLMLTAAVPSGQDLRVAFSSLLGSIFWLLCIAAVAACVWRIWWLPF